MASLEGAKIVVAGGAGGVGEGIVRALLRRAPACWCRRAARNGCATWRLCQDVADRRAADAGRRPRRRGARRGRSRAQIFERFRELDVAVASLGGWWQGKPLTSVDMATWERILRENLTAHFLAVKMLVPLLHPKSGSYVHVNGFSAEQPYPMAGPVAMAPPPRSRWR